MICSPKLPLGHLLQCFGPVSLLMPVSPQRLPDYRNKRINFAATLAQKTHSKEMVLGPDIPSKTQRSCPPCVRLAGLSFSVQVSISHLQYKYSDANILVK